MSRCAKHDCEMVPVTTNAHGKPRRGLPHYRCPQCVEEARAKVAHEKGLGIRRGRPMRRTAGSKCL
jgi:hypothetical protein